MSMNVIENVLEWIKDSDTATLTLCQGRYITKVKKLAEQYPDECEIVHENPDGSILAHVPVKWIRISRLTREMTDEQRDVARENVRKAQEAKRNKSKNNFDGSEDS